MEKVSEEDKKYLQNEEKTILNLIRVKGTLLRNIRENQFD